MRWNTVIFVILALLLVSLAATTQLHRHVRLDDVSGKQRKSPSASSSSSDDSARSLSLPASSSSSSSDSNGESETSATTLAKRGGSIFEHVAPVEGNGGDDAHTNSKDDSTSTSPAKGNRRKQKQQQQCDYARGRDKDSSDGCAMNPDSCCCHAWGMYEENAALRCHGTQFIPDCTSRAAFEYAAKHILFVIVTGGAATYRVEVSQCTWLGKLPADNIYVITDRLPTPRPRTPHHWLRAELPAGMRHRGDTGDFESDFMTKGYVHAVRKAGQGYNAGWILAQTRFTYGLKYAANVAVATNSGSNAGNQSGSRSSSSSTSSGKHIKWIMLIDDDTIVQLDHLVERVRHIDENQHPWYFSRRGWGGAGHLYGKKAIEILHDRLHECEHKYFVRQFRASDAMLLKCAGHLKLRDQMEHTMSHCPAATRPENVENPHQVTMHGKKDFYPPVLKATWRVSLYYLAMYCKSPKAVKDVVKWSACTYGASCKRATCDKVVDQRRERLWDEFSHNNTLRMLPVNDYLGDIHAPTR